MELFRLLGTIAVENGEAKKALDEVSQEGGKTESKLSGFFGGIGRAAATCGKAIAVGLAAGATAMAGLTTKALQLSGDLEQNMGGAEQVFKDLGGSIDEMSTKIITGYDEATGKAIYATTNLETVSKEAYKNMGLSQSDYLATANKMGALFQGAGFETQEALDLSSQAMQRAADVASIMGIDTEAAMEAVAGAAKGNFTMMDNLGVAMNDTAIQNYALEKGINKTTAEMTQQEKIGLAMEMFLDKTSYAAGNYAKENETLAGSLSTAKSAFTNFLAGSGDVDSLVSSFSNLANVIINSLGDIVPRLTTGLTDIVNQVAPMLPGLLNQLLPILIQGATSLINGLVTALPGIVSALTTAAPLLVNSVVLLVNSIVEQLPSLIQTLCSALVTLTPVLIDGIVSMITTLSSNIFQIIQPIIDCLPDLIVGLVESICQNLPIVIEGLIQLTLGIVAAIPELLQALVQAMPTVIELVLTSLLENLPLVIDGLLQVVVGIVAALPEILALLIDAWVAQFEGIWAALGNVFGNVGKWFSDKFKSAKDGAVKAWDDAKTKFNDVKKKCTDAFNDFKEKVGKKFSDAKESAAEKWSDIKDKFSSIKDKVVDGFSNLKDKIGTKFSEAKEAAASKWSDIKSKFTSAKDKVVSAFSDLGSKMKTKFSDAKSKAIEAFSDIKSKVKDVGKNLVEGIWNGISGSMEWIKGKIKGWVGDVTKFLKKLFGIESPSKLMRDEVGRYIAEGVAVGIEENTSKAQKAAEEMSKKVLDAAQKRLDDYKTYNELTLADEVGFWDEVRKKCKEGTDARIQADKKYLEAKNSLNKEILNAEETLQTKLDGIYQKIDERAKEIASTFDIFEAPGIDEKLTPSEMFDKLESQVEMLEVYNKHIESLRGKIGDTDLFKELESKGLQALPQIFTIDNMDINYLNKYIELYNERSQLAKDFASNSLADETAAETEKAFREYADALASVGVEIVEETEAMKSGAVNNVKAMLEEFTKALEEFSPKMKLPHFKIEGSLDIAQGTVPTVGVEWYKKAMNNAMLLDKPTIFGFNNANGNLMGGGEAGSEVVAGSTTLMNMIQNAVAEQNGTLSYYLQKIVELLATFFPEQIDSFRV